ncbi:Transposase DDE domain-containing protein [Cryobacterium levicorallinum]|uniref:Transposase DDE domain-containing protein n=1 Tax=Cryobacterium levicorallinum TaxID=995038 RepID=A0ABY1EDD2_9MICO|nr:Transposase DDE domain-containing protein [Cryobacterium levicorallinum]
MVYYVMALALFSARSYEEVMRSLLAGMEWVTGRFREWTLPSRAAIFQARTRLGSTMMVELFAQVAKPFGVSGGGGFSRKWPLVSVDGTTLDLADVPAIERAYGRPGTKTEFKSAFPQTRVLGLVEGGTHAVISAVVSGYHTAEHDLYPALLADLKKDMLLSADRGFYSYSAWKDSVATGADLLWLMKANNLLPVLKELADGSYLSTLYPSSKDRRNNTAGIPVRVIEYDVTTGEDVSTFRLITNILDPVAADADDLASAYAKRWEIESCFDELKTHQLGPGLVLRSKTPDGVLQEIYGFLCVHYAIRSLIGTVAQHFEEDPLRFSFTGTLRAARRSLAARPAFSPSAIGWSLHQLLPGNHPRAPALTTSPRRPTCRQTQNVQMASQENTQTKNLSEQHWA